MHTYNLLLAGWLAAADSLQTFINKLAMSPLVLMLMMMAEGDGDGDGDSAGSSLVVSRCKCRVCSRSCAERKAVQLSSLHIYHCRWLYENFQKLVRVPQLDADNFRCECALYSSDPRSQYEGGVSG